MRILLDTHSFIWWDSEPERLSVRALQACREPSNALLISVASLWEMQIKYQGGKLTLHRPLKTILDDHVRAGTIILLPIRADDVLALDRLPPHHRDPFDRLLAAQSIVEDVPLMTRDPVFKRYPVSVLW